MQIRFCLRNHEHSAPPPAMQEIPADTVADTVQKLTEAFNEVKVPVATEQQVHENLDMLGLPVPMHEALAGSGTALGGVHEVGPEGLMHVSHASMSSVMQGSNYYKATTRLVCNSSQRLFVYVIFGPFLSFRRMGGSKQCTEIESHCGVWIAGRDKGGYRCICMHHTQARTHGT